MYASSLIRLCTVAAVAVSTVDGVPNATLSMYLHTYTAQSTLKIVQEKNYMRLDFCTQNKQKICWVNVTRKINLFAYWGHLAYYIYIFLSFY